MNRWFVVLATVTRVSSPAGIHSDDAIPCDFFVYFFNIIIIIISYFFPPEDADISSMYSVVIIHHDVYACDMKSKKKATRVNAHSYANRQFRVEREENTSRSLCERPRTPAYVFTYAYRYSVDVCMYVHTEKGKE